MSDVRQRHHRRSGSSPAPPSLRRDQALFLDFDGTLVEIAPAPNQVQVPAELPHLLDELADRLDGAVAVVSGRSLDELAHMLAPFASGIAGNHGLERRYGDGNVTRCLTHPELDRFRPLVADFATRHDGVLLEDKGGSLALHYRLAPSLAAGCHTLVRRAAQASNGALVAVAGKMVIELMPRSGGKGRAIADFLADAPFRGRLPVFVGDDTTDEDGFAVVNRLGGVSVHVGDGATIARHCLATVGEVLAWLAQGLGK
jgi:trehalose 6-phosphate phosphatase